MGFVYKAIYTFHEIGLMELDRPEPWDVFAILTTHNGTQSSWLNKSINWE